MSTPAPSEKVRQAIDQMSPQQLAQVWAYIQQLTTESVAPLYRVHEHAIATGVAHLAERHNQARHGQAESDA